MQGSPPRSRPHLDSLKRDRATPDSAYGCNDELKHHCTLISEVFLRAFVKGTDRVVCARVCPFTPHSQRVRQRTTHNKVTVHHINGFHLCKGVW